jgi:glutathione-regulated potassium-efflux system protein KefB
VAVAAGSVLLIVFLGRRIMNPVFRFLAAAKAREVMTSAALVVVLGAALIMQTGGLSMAMGAFLAGVLLSTSSFRHQLEADVEPFRGVLLGVFFLAVGMSLDLGVIGANWQLIAFAVIGYMSVKSLAIYALARVLRSSHREAMERAFIMAQGGEFAFVLYNSAAAAGIFTGDTNAIFTATVIISMVLTPLGVAVLPFLLPKQVQSMDGVEVAEGLTDKVLVVGFGRFGQIVTQPLLALGHSISIIDNDADMIRAAAQFGFKIYYGDGTRLDILHAAGAGTADIALICIDKPAEATRIANLLRDEFPMVKVMARAFDRGHALELIKAGVQYQLRETFESALAFSAATAMELGATREEADVVIFEVRKRDAERFRRQMLGDGDAANDLLIANARDQAREGGVRPPANAVASDRDTADVGASSAGQPRS